MNLFRKRPLSTILCILLGGFSVFTLLPSVYRYIAIGIGGLLLVLSVLLVRRFRYLPIVSSAALLLSFVLSFLYFDLYFPIYNRVQDEQTIEGRVIEVVYNESFETMIEVQTDKLSDIPFSRCRLLVTFIPADDTQLDIGIGDSVSFVGKLERISSSEDGFDSRSYYEMRGVQAAVQNAESVSVTKLSGFSLRKWMNDQRSRLCAYIERSADDATAGLLCALITGERSALHGQLRLDFKRIGLTHILAVSGMHLAILTTALHKLLSLFGLDKKLRCVIAMLFVTVYLGITGFPMSVLRAGGMVLLSNLLFLTANTRDSVTNLTISTFLICLISPYASRDISLLLSFFATLGVLASVQMLENVPYHISKWKKILIAIAASLLSSFFAIAITLPFSVFYFGRISYVAPITTLIFSLLTEVFMYLGGAFLIFGAPAFLLYPLKALTKAIEALAAFFAELPEVYLLADSVAVRLICILFYLLFCLFLILKVKHKKSAIVFLSLVLLSVFIVGYFDTTETLKDERIVYCSDNEENDAFFLYNDGKVTIVNLTKNTNDAKNYLQGLIESERLVSLDGLWMPQYFSGLPKALCELASSLPIKTFYLPTPSCDDEASLLLEAEQALKGYRSEISLIGDRESHPVESAKLYSVYRAPMDEGTRVILSLKLNGYYHTYVSRGGIVEQNRDLADYVMGVSRSVVFGTRGRQPSEKYYLEFASDHTELLVFQNDEVEISEAVYDEIHWRTRMVYQPKVIVLTEK